MWSLHMLLTLRFVSGWQDCSAVLVVVEGLLDCIAKVKVLAAPSHEMRVLRQLSKWVGGLSA